MDTSDDVVGGGRAIQRVIKSYNTTMRFPRVLPITATGRFPVVPTHTASMNTTAGTPALLRVLNGRPVAVEHPTSAKYAGTDAATANPITSTINVNEVQFSEMIQSIVTRTGDENIILHADLAYDAIRSHNEDVKKAVKAKRDAAKAEQAAAASSSSSVKSPPKGKKRGKQAAFVDDDETKAKEPEFEVKHVELDLKVHHGNFNPAHRELFKIPHLLEGYYYANTDFNFYKAVTLQRARLLNPQSIFTVGHGPNSFETIRQANLNAKLFAAIGTQLAINAWTVINGRWFSRSPPKDGAPEDFSKPAHLLVLFSADTPTKTLLRRIPTTKGIVKLKDYDFVAAAQTRTLTEFIFIVLQLMTEACEGSFTGSEDAKVIRNHVTSGFSNDRHKGMHAHRFTAIPMVQFVTMFNGMRADDQVGKVALEWRQMGRKSKATDAEAGVIPADAIFRPVTIVEYATPKGRLRFTAAFLFLPLVYTSLHVNQYLPAVPPIFEQIPSALVKHMRRFFTSTVFNEKQSKAALKKAQVREAADEKKKAKAKAKTKAKAKDDAKESKVASFAEAKVPGGSASVVHDRSVVTAAHYAEHGATPANLAYSYFTAFKSGVCIFPSAAMIAHNPRDHIMFPHYMHNPAAISNMPCNSVYHTRNLSDMFIPDADDPECPALTTSQGTWYGDTTPVLRRGKANDDKTNVAIWSHCTRSDAAHLCFAEGADVVHYNNNARQFLLSDHMRAPARSAFFDHAFEAIGSNAFAAKRRLYMAADVGCFKDAKDVEKITAHTFFLAYINVLQARLIFVNEADIFYAAFQLFAEYFLELCPNHDECTDFQQKQIEMCIIDIIRQGERIFWAWLNKYVGTICPSAHLAMYDRYTVTWDGVSELKAPDSMTGERNGTLGFFSNDSIAAFFRNNTAFGKDVPKKVLDAIRGSAAMSCFKVDGEVTLLPNAQEAAASIQWPVDLTVSHLVSGEAKDANIPFKCEDIKETIQTMVLAFHVFALTPIAMLTQEWHHYHGSVLMYQSHSESKHAVDWTSIATVNAAQPIITVANTITRIAKDELNKRAKQYGDNSMVLAFDSILGDLKGSSTLLPDEIKSVMNLFHAQIPDPAYQGYFMAKIGDLKVTNTWYADGMMTNIQYLVAESLIQMLPVMARGMVNVTPQYIEEYLFTQANTLFMDPHRPRDMQNGCTPQMCLARMFAIIPAMAANHNCSYSMNSAIESVISAATWPDKDKTKPSRWVIKMREDYQLITRNMCAIPAPAKPPVLEIQVIGSGSGVGAKRGRLVKDEEETKPPSPKRLKIEPPVAVYVPVVDPTKKRTPVVATMDTTEDVDHEVTPIPSAADEAKAKAAAEEAEKQRLMAIVVEGEKRKAAAEEKARLKKEMEDKVAQEKAKAELKRKAEEEKRRTEAAEKAEAAAIYAKAKALADEQAAALEARRKADEQKVLDDAIAAKIREDEQKLKEANDKRQAELDRLFEEAQAKKAAEAQAKKTSPVNKLFSSGMQGRKSTTPSQAIKDAKVDKPTKSAAAFF